MTIRPGPLTSRNSPTAVTSKSSAKGMDVEKMNDFEQRHLPNKSRSHSPYGHIGSPTTPLNFEHLFLQSQLSLNSDLSQQEQAMLQAQLLNNMRSTGMGPRPKQQQQQPQQSLVTLDQLRQVYNRGEQEQAHSRGEQEHAEWNTRLFTAAAAQQQHQLQQDQGQILREDPSNEPSINALLAQKFAQLERQKAEIQKSASQPQQVQVQLYPSQWSVPSQQQSNAMAQSVVVPPASSVAPSESARHSAQANGHYFSFQNQPPRQPQHQHVGMGEPRDQYYGTKQEMNWRASQDSRANASGAGWSVNNAAVSSHDMASSSHRMYLSQQHLQQPQQFKQPQAIACQPQIVSYQMQQQQQQQPMSHQRVEFAVPQAQPFSSFQLNGLPAVDVGTSGPMLVSSRCDKTGGKSVEITGLTEHHGDDLEMSVDNFSGRLSSMVCQSQNGPAPNSQVSFSNNFHMLPQSSKSAFSIFTRPSSNLNPSTEAGFVTRSLLFNDTYKSSGGDFDMTHNDVDTELRL